MPDFQAWMASDKLYSRVKQNQGEVLFEKALPNRVITDSYTNTQGYQYLESSVIEDIPEYAFEQAKTTLREANSPVVGEIPMVLLREILSLKESDYKKAESQGYLSQYLKMLEEEAIILTKQKMDALIITGEYKGGEGQELSFENSFLLSPKGFHASGLAYESTSQVNLETLMQLFFHAILSCEENQIKADTLFISQEVYRFLLLGLGINNSYQNINLLATTLMGESPTTQVVYPTPLLDNAEGGMVIALDKDGSEYDILLGKMPFLAQNFTYHLQESKYLGLMDCVYGGPIFHKDKAFTRFQVSLP